MNNKLALGVIGVSILLIVGILISAARSSTSDSSTTISETSKAQLQVRSNDHVRGNQSASVVLIEYLDFQCPACAAYHPVVNQLVADYGDRVLFVTRHFPLSGHRNGQTSSLAVEAANMQGKFWEMHDAVFEHQSEWSSNTTASTAHFEPYAKNLGLDLDKFKSDSASSQVAARVQEDVSSGNSIGVTGTPSFFLNGVKIQNPRSLEEFKNLLDSELNKTAAQTPTEPFEVHEHADIAVFLSGKKLDLSLDKYQSTDENHLDEATHVHDNNGNILHKHQTGVTLGKFFSSLSMELTDSCFKLDDGKSYCIDDSNRLKVFVNQTPVENYASYEVKDLDRILVSYGPKDENLESQFSALTDDACIYSETCPERGSPPEEECVGGLGTTCD